MSAITAPVAAHAAHRPSWTRLLLAAAIVVFVVIGARLSIFGVSNYTDRVFDTSEHWEFQDYIVFYSAGNLIAQGEGRLIYDIQRMGDVECDALGQPDAPCALPFSYPPFVAAPYAAVGVLSVRAAAAALGAVSLALAFAAAWVILRLLGPLDKLQTVCVALGFLTLWPVANTFSQGQLSLVLLLAWAGWISLASHGRERASGFALALLLIKPQLAVLSLALLVWKKRWTPLCSVLILGAVFTLVSVLISGPDVLIEYPRSLIERAGNDTHEANHSHTFYGWNGFFWLFVPYGGAAHVALSALFAVLTLAVSALAWRGDMRPNTPAFLHGVGSLILATLLINPHVLTHDLALVSLPIVLSARAHRLETGSFGPWAWIAAAAWPALIIGPMSGVNFVTPLMAALMLYQVREARRTSALSEPQIDAETRAA